LLFDVVVVVFRRVMVVAKHLVYLVVVIDVSTVKMKEKRKNIPEARDAYASRASFIVVECYRGGGGRTRSLFSCK